MRNFVERSTRKRRRRAAPLPARRKVTREWSSCGYRYPGGTTTERNACRRSNIGYSAKFLLVSAQFGGLSNTCMTSHRSRVIFSSWRQSMVRSTTRRHHSIARSMQVLIISKEISSTPFSCLHLRVAGDEVEQEVPPWSLRTVYPRVSCPSRDCE